MKTLWEKLTDVNKGKLLFYKEQYPYVGKKLITTLETEITINNLMELFYEQ